MKKWLHNLSFYNTALAGLILACLAVTGCDSCGPGRPSSSDTANAKPTAAVTADPLKDLSPADRAIAEKQKVCPITGEELGSMGTPFKVTYKDRVAFLCCDGCKDKFDKEPEKWLKKIDDRGKK